MNTIALLLALIATAFWLSIMYHKRSDVYRAPGPSIPSCPICGKIPLYGRDGDAWTLYCHDRPNHSIKMKLSPGHVAIAPPDASLAEIERDELAKLWMETFPRVRIPK